MTLASASDKQHGVRIRNAGLDVAMTRENSVLNMKATPVIFSGITTAPEKT
jgi:hypothetical protein